MVYQIFDHKDRDYLQWLAQNRFGFVINTTRHPDPDYMVLHRASCYSIKEYFGNAEEGGFTEREYIKICSADLDSLKRWVRQDGRPDGSFSSECPHCAPSYSWEDGEDELFDE